MSKSTQKHKKPKTKHQVKEADPAYPDSLFYKGDYLPELTQDPPIDTEIYQGELVRNLIPGINWRKSEQGQQGYKRLTGWEEED